MTARIGQFNQYFILDLPVLGVNDIKKLLTR